MLFELEKVREWYHELTEEVLADKLLAWGYLLTSGYRQEADVEGVIETYPDMGDFAELYGLAADDPKVVAAYEDARSAVFEHNLRLEYYESLRNEGREEERGRIAAALRAAGADESLIAAVLSG